MELNESKKMIATFMGWQEMPTNRKDWMLSETIDGIKYAKKQKSVAHMEFNTSWDWLMPVIEKISNLEMKYLNVNEYFNPYPRTFGMQDESGLYLFRFNDHCLFSHQNLIVAAYEAVVDFLEGYTKQEGRIL
jgi:hypothetical protein